MLHLSVGKLNVLLKKKKALSWKTDLDMSIHFYIH